jgi:glycosyltransferase involved in cell wall biosynthesis
MVIIPKLSIIIPNYNNYIFLNECLESILAQTFRNYEIIICDDCSTDNSFSLIEQYAKRYNFIRTIYHKKNIGIAKNRNSGIQIAKGQYITVLDSDDIYYDSHKLEKEMEIVEYYKETENKTVCAFSKIAMLDKNLNFIRDQWTEDKIKEGYIFNEILSRTAMIPRDYILTSEAYKIVGKYDALCQPYEDWDLKIRIAKKYDFYYTGIYGTGYRKHGNGLSNISTEKNIRILKKVFNKNFHLVETNNKSLIKRNFNNFTQSIRLNHINSLSKTISTYNFKLKTIHSFIYIRILINKYLYSIKKK